VVACGPQNVSGKRAVAWMTVRRKPCELLLRAIINEAHTALDAQRYLVKTTTSQAGTKHNFGSRMKRALGFAHEGRHKTQHHGDHGGAQWRSFSFQRSNVEQCARKTGECQYENYHCSSRGTLCGISEHGGMAHYPSSAPRAPLSSVGSMGTLTSCTVYC
jgi:hypothetical protein